MLYISDSVTQFLRRELLASGEVSEFSSCPAHSAPEPAAQHSPRRAILQAVVSAHMY